MKQATIVQLAKRLMAKYTPLPLGSSGKFRIEQHLHPAGSQMFVVSMREALFSGLPKTDLTLSLPYLEQKLSDTDNGIWMTNLPCELVQMWRDFANHAYGRVLIGGLGLGVATSMCLRRPLVRTVTTVERSPDVIKLNAINAPGSGYFRTDLCVQADLFEYLKLVKSDQYDCALLDIWQGTGEWVWQTEVVPLLRLIQTRIPIIRCWQEAVMRGQVSLGLPRAADVPEEMLYERATCHYYAFRKAVVDAGIRKVPRIGDPTDFANLFRIEEENRHDTNLRQFARQFLNSVGTPSWEKTFGLHWDAAYERSAPLYDRKERPKNAKPKH
jgi:hypothetical protein